MKSLQHDPLLELKLKLLNEVATHLEEPNCQCKLVDIIKKIGEGMTSPQHPKDTTSHPVTKRNDLSNG